MKSCSTCGRPPETSCEPCLSGGPPAERLSLPRCEQSDLPRLLCGCSVHAEWAFEWDDLTEAEHDYLDPEEQGWPQSDRRPVGAVRPLPEYTAPPQFSDEERARAKREKRPLMTGQAWGARNNVDVPATGPTCPVCAKRPTGDAFMCPECLDDLEVALGNVPGLLADLVVFVTRQHRLAQVQRERKSAEHTRWDHVLAEHDFEGNHQGRLLASKGYNRVPYVPSAGNAIATLSSEVTTAVRSLCEPRGVPLPTLDAAGASRWLLSHLASVALDVAGPDITVGVLRETARAMRLIDGTSERVYIGLCRCGTAMHADPSLPEHRCTTCSTEYVVEDRRKLMHERLMGSLLSLTELAEISQDRTNFGQRLSRKQLEGWVRRKRLIRRGSRPDGPEREVALYRAGDVLGLVSAKIAC